jgi:uncharacterized membrane protein HdeD (DUF308 family)
MKGKSMANFSAWSLLVLGVLHVLYGVVKFRLPLSAAVAEGFVGKFSKHEARRTAFWFVMFGPLLMMGGHICIHAVARSDYDVMRLVGTYLSVGSLIGVAALPKSPFIVGLTVSLLVMAAGYRLI